MQNKTSLLNGAALGVIILSAISVDAQAKPSRHYRARPVAATGNDPSPLEELRAEVESLKAWRDGQIDRQAQADAQLNQVKTELAQSQDRTRVAEAKVAAQIETIPGAVKAEVAKIAPKTDKLYVKGVSIQLGGFLEASSVYRSKNLDSDIATNFNAIPYGANAVGHTNETRFSARHSRISALIQGDVSKTVHLSGYGELDFLGAAQTANSNQTNSYNPRIRHMYLNIDWDEALAPGWGLHLLAGQTWSLATMNTKGITPRNELQPSVIDPQYVPGYVFTRQPQFRLTADYKKQFWIAVSAENPQTTFFSSGKYESGVNNVLLQGPAGSGFNSANTLSLNHIPDFVGKVAAEETIQGHSLHLEAFGILRSFYDRVDILGVIKNHDTIGGGFGGGFVFNLIPKRVDIQGSAIVGKGIGRYGASALPDVTVDVDGGLHPIHEWAALIGGTVHATPKLDLYAFGGEERASSQSFSDPTAKVQNGYGNLAYDNSGCDIERSTVCVGNTRYVEQFTAGFIHRPYQGAFGRIQWGVQYSYTERHAFAGVGGAPVAKENMIFTTIRYYPF